MKAPLDLLMVLQRLLQRVHPYLVLNLRHVAFHLPPRDSHVSLERIECLQQVHLRESRARRRRSGLSAVRPLAPPLLGALRTEVAAIKTPPPSRGVLGRLRRQLRAIPARRRRRRSKSGPRGAGRSSL